VGYGVARATIAAEERATARRASTPPAPWGAYPFAVFTIPCACDSALEVVPFSAPICAWAFLMAWASCASGPGVRGDVGWV
jgi:hypothetical protein